MGVFVAPLLGMCQATAARGADVSDDDVITCARAASQRTRACAVPVGADGALCARRLRSCGLKAMRTLVASLPDAELLQLLPALMPLLVQALRQGDSARSSARMTGGCVAAVRASRCSLTRFRAQRLARAVAAAAAAAFSTVPGPARPARAGVRPFVRRALRPPVAPDGVRCGRLACLSTTAGCVSPAHTQQMLGPVLRYGDRRCRRCYCHRRHCVHSRVRCAAFLTRVRCAGPLAQGARCRQVAAHSVRRQVPQRHFRRVAGGARACWLPHAPPADALPCPAPRPRLAR